jgi:hypothetical protein
MDCAHYSLLWQIAPSRLDAVLGGKRNLAFLK